MNDYLVKVVSTKIITTVYRTSALNEDDAVSHTENYKVVSNDFEVLHRITNVEPVGDT
jgi:hypothetical protein